MPLVCTEIFTGSNNVNSYTVNLASQVKRIRILPLNQPSLIHRMFRNHTSCRYRLPGAHLSAQAQKVLGRVTSSADGTALPGFRIGQRHTNAGTTTDNGIYSIDASANEYAGFFFIGFSKQRSCWKPYYH